MFDDGADEEFDDESGGEARKMKRIVDPHLPSKDEVEEHNLTHLPVRNWCKHCMRGRGKHLAHEASKGCSGQSGRIQLRLVFPRR